MIKADNKQKKKKIVINCGNIISDSKNAKSCCLLTLDVNKITVDDVNGRVVSLTAVPAAVCPGQERDVVVRVVAVNGDGVHRIFIVRAVPLKGDRRSAFNATDKVEIISFSDFCQVWDDDQGWVGERHCGEERDQ